LGVVTDFCGDERNVLPVEGESQENNSIRFGDGASDCVQIIAFFNLLGEGTNFRHNLSKLLRRTLTKLHPRAITRSPRKSPD